MTSESVIEAPSAHNQAISFEEQQALIANQILDIFREDTMPLETSIRALEAKAADILVHRKQLLAQIAPIEDKQAKFSSILTFASLFSLYGRGCSARAQLIASLFRLAGGLEGLKVGSDDLLMVRLATLHMGAQSLKKLLNRLFGDNMVVAMSTAKTIDDEAIYLLLVSQLSNCFGCSSNDSLLRVSNEEKQKAVSQKSLWVEAKIEEAQKLFQNFSVVRLRDQEEEVMDLEEEVEVEDVQRLADFVESSLFTLVRGPEYSGKTKILEKFVKNSPQKRFIRLYVTNTLDLKSLIGTYVCSERIGEFEWRDGPLSSAYKNGYFLVLENLQEGKEELRELIASVLEGTMKIRELSEVPRHAGFKVIASWRSGVHHLKDDEIQEFICYKPYIRCLDLEKIEQQQILDEADLPDMIVEIVLNLHNGSLDLVDQLKNHSFMPDILKFKRLCTRIQYHYIQIYGKKVTKNLSLNSKLIFIHDFYEIYLDSVRDFIPQPLLIMAANILEITTNEIEVFLDNYECTIVIKDDIKTTRFQSNDFISIKPQDQSTDFIQIRHSKNLVEKIFGCLQFKNNLLLVGETGCGKTTAVQETAKLLGKNLFVYNMSQSSDVSDLMGGFKPMDAKSFLEEYFKKFQEILSEADKLHDNKKVVVFIRKLLRHGDIVKTLVCLLKYSSDMMQKLSKEKNQQKTVLKLNKFIKKLKIVHEMRDKLASRLIFKYLKGNMVKAIKNGDWILLDEVNLAEYETLCHLAPLLEGKSVSLIEQGKLKEVTRHPDFRIIACMNPGNSVGKKELNMDIRKRFVECYVEELEAEDELIKIALKRSNMSLSHSEAEKIVKIYLSLREMSIENQIEDGFGRRPKYTLRSLCRAVDIGRITRNLYGGFKDRSVFEAILGSFASNLNPRSKEKVLKEFETRGFDMKAYAKILRGCKGTKMDHYQNIKGFLLRKGSQKLVPIAETGFLLTKTVEKTVINLLRVVAHSEFPVLLEGPTSAGKTSMIKFLAAASGNRCVRINNHQHTDLDEYIGTYSPDETGKLVFKRGLLVEAMEKGYWLILDELNLAKSEILEALNRLLDDNRELFIPEINKLIKPHHDFRIFATQNPISYGGRKELSEAFRSRFIHFYFEELQKEDLIEIVDNTCNIPRSRAEKLVSIMHELKSFRTRQNFFAGKESLITIRDLLKLGFRDIVDMERMAEEANCVLVERLRHQEDQVVVRSIIEKICIKNDKIDLPLFYKTYCDENIGQENMDKFTDIFWSENFMRMFTLVMKCVNMKEPSLMIGETGCGKTTAAEMIAKLKGVKLFTISCHQYTESSDFIGSLRPLRNREGAMKKLRDYLQELSEHEEAKEMSNENIVKLLKEAHDDIIAHDEQLTDKLKELGLHFKQVEKLEKLIKRVEQIFEWVDGPLVTCMREGGVLLIDEISLAQDSVLERLNSVLEKEKTLVLSEKGDCDIVELKAHEDCIIIATMNPSGDFGKKELTPALRNRFTEIWVKPITELSILSKNSEQLLDEKMKIAKLTKSQIENDLWDFLKQQVNLNFKIQNFTENDVTTTGLKLEFMVNSISLCLFRVVFNFNSLYSKKLKPLTLRDLKSTIKFLTHSPKKFNFQRLGEYLWILLGGYYCMVEELAIDAHQSSLNIVNKVLKQLSVGCPKIERLSSATPEIIETDTSIGSDDYIIPKRQVGGFEDSKYSISQKTVSINLQRIIDAFFVGKAILLEGPPGVGKTSLIEILAKKIGVKLYRINLSEQTDLIDLLGSDIPTDSSSLFTWADGVLLKAMKEGAWLLLDELNMASQTVLEGLNSILDHRGNIYLPELDVTVEKKEGFKIFASQNPMAMGSGRKGLPHSFLTRFTRIWLQAYSRGDLKMIIQSVYHKELQHVEIQRLIEFFFEIKDRFGDTSNNGWEFNLRDLHTIFDMLEVEQSMDVCLPEAIAKISKVVVFNRLLTQEQISEAREIFERCFEFEYTAKFSGLLTSQAIFDPSLDLSSIPKISEIVYEPILNDLEVVARLKYPVLFMTERETEKVLKVEQLVEHLARINNKQLRVINLFSSSDIVDIVGSFEQISLSSKIENLVQLLIDEILRHQEGKITKKQQKLVGFLLTYSHDPKTGLTELINQISGIEDLNLPAFKSIHGINESLLNDEGVGQNIFTWIESEMVECIKSGKWVYIKGVESVNPAILERLNAIMEKGETVFLNEALGGTEDNKEIKKHPNFKIFLKFDESKARNSPSRALRNRCVEFRMKNFLPYQNDLLENLSPQVFEISEDITILEKSLQIDNLRCLNSEETIVAYERIWSNYIQILGLSEKHHSEANLSMTISDNFLRKKQALVREIFRSCVFSTHSCKHSSQENDTQNHDSIQYLQVSKQTLMNKQIGTAMSSFMETLIKSMPNKYYPIDQDVMKNNLKGLILGLLDESSIEKCQDEIEALTSADYHELLALFLMLRPLVNLKYSFRQQSEDLLQMFSEQKMEDMEIEKVDITNHDTTQESLKYIRCPEEFLLNCILMTTYTDRFIFNKFVSFEKVAKSEELDLSSLKKLLSEETLMKLNVIKNSAYHPVALTIESLGQLCEHYNLQRLKDISSVKDFIALLSTSIHENFDKAIKNFLLSFKIFEYTEEFFDDHDTYDKAIFVPIGQNVDTMNTIIAKIDSVESLCDDQQVKICLNLIEEEFIFSKEASTLISNFKQTSKLHSGDNVMKQIGFFVDDKKLMKMLKSVQNKAYVKQFKEYLRKIERLKGMKVGLAEVELIEGNLKFIEDADAIEDTPELADQIEMSVEDLVKNVEFLHLPKLRKPDRYSQKQAVDVFKQLTYQELDVVQLRIANFEAGKFQSLMTHSTKVKLLEIKDTLSRVSEILNTKKIRSINLNDLGRVISASEDVENDGNCLSAAISRVFQGSFFNCNSRISQNIMDQGEQALVLLKTMTESLNRAHLENYEKLVVQILESSIENGDIIVFNDVIVPMLSDLSSLIFKFRTEIGKRSVYDVQYLKNQVSEQISAKYTDKSDITIGELKLLRHLELDGVLEKFMEVYESGLFVKSNKVKSLNKIGKGSEIDQASKLQNLQKGIEKLVVNEYTQEAVDANKKKEREEIRKIFGIEKEADINVEGTLLFETQNLKDAKIQFLKFVYTYDLDFFFESTHQSDTDNQEILSAFINLDIEEVNNSVLHKKGLQNLTKDTMKQILGKMLKSYVVEMKDLSILQKAKHIHCGLPLASFWKEQVLQLINVQQHGFYRGCEKSELAESQKILSKLLQKVQEKKEDIEIGNRESLNHIINAVSKYVSMSLVNTSLNKAADMMEKIIVQIRDHENNVIAKYHISEKDELIALLSKWRKKERRTWRTLLSIQNLDEILDDLEVCIKFKQVIMSQSLRKSKQKEIFTIVENFLRTPKHFAFINRLCWVEVVLTKLRKKAKHQEAISIIEGIWAYYTNFLQFSLEKYKEMFANVDKPIREIEKLSNWHMEDFVNLKMNIQKYHKGINRAMKNHKDILDQKASMSIVEAKRNTYLHEDEENMVSIMQTNGFIYEGELSIYEEEDEEVIEKEDDEKALEQADKNARVFVEVIKERKKKEIKPRVNKVINKKIIETFVDNYMAQKAGDVERKVIELMVRDLRVLKPTEWMNIMLDETRNPKKELKYKEYQNGYQVLEEEVDMWFTQLVELKQVKNRPVRERALMDFLKVLKNFGFTFSTKIANFEITDVLLNLKGCMTGLQRVKNRETKISKMNDRLYETLDMLLVQQYNGKYSEDIQPVYRERMQGSCISLLSKTSKQIGKSCILFNKVNDLDDLYRHKQSNYLKYKGSEFLDAYLSTQKEEKQVEDLFENYFEDEIKVKLAVRNCINEFKGGFMDFNTLKQKLKLIGDNSDVLEILSQLSEYTPEEKQQIQDDTDLESKRLILDFSAMVKEYDDSILKENAFKAEKHFLSKSIQFLKNLSKKLKNIPYLLNFSPMTQPIKLALVLQEHFINWLQSRVKFGYLAAKIFHNLLYKGFCAKVYEQEEIEGEDEYDFGTGIGEGKGDDNANENYEFEEQLLGEQGEKGEKNDDENSDSELDDEDDDKAMDMENEFDGETGDAAEDQKNKEEVDDAFDEVDNADMDRKLWDEENQDMEDEEDERSENEKEGSLRDDEEIDFEGEQKEDQTETKAKEFDDKQTRDAKDDYDDQQEKEAEKEEKEDGVVDEKELDDADVEELSSMSEREENENMDFDDEAEGEKEGQEEQNDEEGLEEGAEDFGDLDQNLEEEDIDQEGENQEDFEDPLDQEERNFEEEKAEDVENEDALEEKGADQNNEAEVDEQENLPDEDDKGAKQGGEAAKEDENEQDQMQDEKEQVKQDDQNEEKGTEDQIKMEKELEKEKLKELMENISLVANQQDNLEEKEIDLDNFDAIEKADGDDDAAFKVSAPAGVNMDSKNEDKDKEADMDEKPMLKIQDQVKNDDEKMDQENDENEEIRDNLDTKQQKEDEAKKDEDEEELLGKRENEEVDEEEDLDNTEKMVKRERLLSVDEEIPQDRLIELMKMLINKKDKSDKDTRSIWTELEAGLQDGAYYLSEELRNIFKPTKIAGMKGDYRTGKRLNMRKVISYVASNYRKDKIWLRRAEPSQKDYQINLAIDDSLSMTDKDVGYFGLQAMTTLAIALSKLEVGEISITAVRNGMTTLHPFDRPFFSSEGAKLISDIGFDFSDQQSADFGLAKFMRESIDEFAKDSRHKICFVLSDGRFNKDVVRPFCLEAEEAGILYIYIVLDNDEANKSIMSYRTSKVRTVNGKPKVEITPYLEDFPFKNYIIVKNIKELTGILVSILRDYFSKFDM